MENWFRITALQGADAGHSITVSGGVFLTVLLKSLLVGGVSLIATLALFWVLYVAGARWGMPWGDERMRPGEEGWLSTAVISLVIGLVAVLRCVFPFRAYDVSVGMGVALFLVGVIVGIACICMGGYVFRLVRWPALGVLAGMCTGTSAASNLCEAIWKSVH